MALPEKPLTRKEKYLANIAGAGTVLPEKPITREEGYLDYIARNGGGGGGGVTPEDVAAAVDAAKPHGGTITLGATWTGESAPWTQEVTVTGAAVTARSAVTLCPTAAQLAQMIEDGVTALVIANDAGALTVSALGAPTSVTMTVSCLVQETVEAAT